MKSADDHTRALAHDMRDLVVRSGRIIETELEKHVAAFSAHLADPRTTLIDKLIVQAWGQKPI